MVVQAHTFGILYKAADIRILRLDVDVGDSNLTVDISRWYKFKQGEAVGVGWSSLEFEHSNVYLENFVDSVVYFSFLVDLLIFLSFQME